MADLDEPFTGIITLSSEEHAKFLDAIDNPKPPTQALIDLMRDAKQSRVKRIARAMDARRAELINQPLARIWDDLAEVAIEEMRR